MRINSFWTALLFAVVLVGILLSQRYPTANSQQTPIAPVSAVAQRLADTATQAFRGTVFVQAPRVNGDRLFAHLRNLSYERYTEADRDRARTYLTQTLTNAGWKPALQSFASGVNVVAERPGTDPNAGTILVAAHYDTVRFSPGADDNASGTAVVLEVAQLFSNRPTSRTLQVALFDREERGLLGSRAFTEIDSQIANLKGVIVMDMVGYACRQNNCQTFPEGLPIEPPTTQGDFLAIIADQEHGFLLDAFRTHAPITVLDPLLKSQYQPARLNTPGVISLALPMRGLLTPDFLRSDHAPFWLRGVGAVMVTDTANFRTPHYHQPTDQPRTIDRPFFTGSAQIVVNATAKLLEGDGS
ncbi:MAG: M28 family peptidase [Leptolyngbyaceae cyanobacterium bins.59]|nr:M28 family peptidase [Leptolyngbyaceae cyanobacterium bins.59]